MVKFRKRVAPDICARMGIVGRAAMSLGAFASVVRMVIGFCAAFGPGVAMAGVMAAHTWLGTLPWG